MKRIIVILFLIGASGASAQWGPQPVELRDTSVAGFVGMASAGPADSLVYCTSYADFTDVFGSSTAGLANPHLAPSVAGYFANGGASCWVVRVGATGWRANAGSEGEIRLSLVPAAQRDRSNLAIAEDLRRRLAGRVPGMEVRVRAPQGQFILDRILGGDEGLTVEIRGYDLATLDALTGRAVALIEAVPGVTDLDTSLEAGIPQQDIRVNRDKVADLGLSIRDVTELLQTAVAGSKAGEFRREGHSYRILVQLKDAEQRSLDEILDLALTTDSGEKVSLRNVVAAQASRGPVLIERKDQERVVLY